MELNKWKNSKRSIAFIALSMWPVGFIIFGTKTPPFQTGEDLAIVGSVVSFFAMLAAAAFAGCLRFFLSSKPIKEEDKSKRLLQVWVSAFCIAALMAAASIYSGSWPIGLVICGVIVLLGYGVKKQIKGALIALVLLSAAGILAERYFDGSTAWVWMYSMMYWASLRYGLTSKIIVDDK